MDNETMFRPFAPLEEPAGDGTSGATAGTLCCLFPRVLNLLKM